MAMQNFLSKNATRSRSILQFRNRIFRPNNKDCDVFLNHRGSDTKRTVAGLLHHNLTQMRVRPFLDRETLKPGDNLFEKINAAIRNCKVAVAIFSPNYCQSYFCLHELALIMECKKKVIPIFCDVKPSELLALDSKVCPTDELRRFRWALEEARYTVGVTFDSTKGNWSDLLTSATDIIMKTLIEEETQEQEQGARRKNTTPVLY